MKRIPIDEVKIEEDAQDLAIGWQEWSSNQSLSYEEISEWQRYFEELGEKFNLTEEFRENGII
jgi:hypothetical protein